MKFLGVPPCGQRRAEDRPLIRRGIRRDTFPQGGRLFSGGWKPPCGSLRPLRARRPHERSSSLYRDGSLDLPAP